MAKTAIRAIPKDLSSANIYLDDLFEIEEILSQTFASLSPPVSVRFEYEIDERIKITTHEELIEHEGYSSRFIMKMFAESSSIETRVLWMHRFLPPQFEAPYTLGEQRWAVFAKVEPIFKARQGNFKAMAERITTLSMYVVMFGSTIIFYSIARPHGAQHWYASYIFNALLIGGGSVVAYGKLKANRIYFRFVRQDQKAKTAARKELIGKLFLLLAGSILGVLGNMTVNHFKH